MFRTAKDLTPEEIREYQKFLTKREEKKKEYLLQRYQEAWSVAKEAAKLLYNKYRAKKIVVFGSLKDPFYFNKWSDIDLAVCGMPPADFYKAVAFASGFSSVWKVDLVDVDDCSEALREVILKEGIEL